MDTVSRLAQRRARVTFGSLVAVERAGIKRGVGSDAARRKGRQRDLEKLIHVMINLTDAGESPREFFNLRLLLVARHNSH